MTDTAVNYGNSLYDLSAEESLTDPILKDVETVSEIFKSNPEYLRLLGEPSISKDERISLIDQAFRGGIHQYLLNFIKILCEESLLNEFRGCARQFRLRYNRDHNISEAVVTTAYKLDDLQKNALKCKLEEMSGNQVILIEKVDRRFIAGIRVELDGKQYDGTVSGRLDAIGKRISDIKV